jgi:hypothetical protein
MRILRYILAITFGFLAGVVVWLWPQKPLWTKQLPTYVRVLRYQPADGKVIALQMESQSPNQRVLVLNAINGEFLQEFEIFFDTRPNSIIEVGPDLSTAFVSEGKGWSLYDLRTGHRRYGPVRDGFLNGHPWSDDGRWFYSSSMKPGRKRSLLIHSFATGEVIHEFQPPEGYHSGSPGFSPDGSTVKLFWEFVGDDGRTRGDGKKLVSIHELPSGKELTRLTCPENKNWMVARGWNGESLMIVDTKVVAGRLVVACYNVFPFQSNPIESAQLDPILSNLEESKLHELDDYELGPTWIVEKGTARPEKIFGNWFTRVRDWLINKMKVDITPNRYYASCYSRPESTLRFELTGLTAPPTHVVNDGHLLLTSQREQGKDTWTLEAWDLYPSPRWPWSLAVGLGAAALILLLGYSRIKRKRQTVAGIPAT